MSPICQNNNFDGFHPTLCSVPQIVTSATHLPQQVKSITLPNCVFSSPQPYVPPKRDNVTSDHTLLPYLTDLLLRSSVLPNQVGSAQVQAPLGSNHHIFERDAPMFDKPRLTQNHIQDIVAALSKNIDQEVEARLMSKRLLERNQNQDSLLAVWLQRRVFENTDNAKTLLPWTLPQNPIPQPDTMVSLSSSTKPLDAFALSDKITKLLQDVGSRIRCRSDPYIDCSIFDCAQLQKDASKFAPYRSGGVVEPFPDKVFRMLNEVEEQGLTDVVSWFPHGRAFGVHKVDRFVTEILPKYFQQTKWTSFTRQLNLWGFLRVLKTSSRDVGGYYNELFLRGHPRLCLYMKRVNLNFGSQDRRKNKGNRQCEGVDPNFYAMSPC